MVERGYSEPSQAWNLDAAKSFYGNLEESKLKWQQRLHELRLVKREMKLWCQTRVHAVILCCGLDHDNFFPTHQCLVHLHVSDTVPYWCSIEEKEPAK
eukprot:1253568-Amphidinium_carterae.1